MLEERGSLISPRGRKVKGEGGPGFFWGVYSLGDVMSGIALVIWGKGERRKGEIYECL